MILIACPGCGRRKTLEAVSNRPKRCKNCQARAGKVYRHVKIWMVTDYDGDNPKGARQQTYSGLLWLAWASRYKEDWAAMKYRMLYGELPHERGLTAESSVPRQELVAWAISEKARYASAIRKIEKGYESGRSNNLSGFDLSDASEHTGQAVDFGDA